MSCHYPVSGSGSDWLIIASTNQNNYPDLVSETSSTVADLGERPGGSKGQKNFFGRLLPPISGSGWPPNLSQGLDPALHQHVTSDVIKLGSIGGVAIRWLFSHASLPARTLQPKTYLIETRTTTNTRFDLKFCRVFSKNRHPRNLHCTFFSLENMALLSTLEEIKPSLDRRMIYKTSNIW